MKKTITYLLISIMILSFCPNFVFAETATTEETVDKFALVVKNGAAFEEKGVKSSSLIKSGSGLVLGGKLTLRDRSVVGADNKLYYKPGVSFTVVNPDKHATKPSKYCSPTLGEYRITEVKRPTFSNENLVTMDSITVDKKDVTVSASSYIPTINLVGRGNLIFNVPTGKTLFIKTDLINFESAGIYNLGAILIQGGGTVCMDVDNIVGSKTKNINAPSWNFNWETYTLKNENKLVMFVKNSQNNVLSSLRVEGDVYFPKSTTVNGEFKIFGNVVTDGDLIYTGKIKNTSSEEFNVLGQVYAPNGLVSTKGAARIRGQLIANSAELYDNSTIVYYDFKYVTVTPDTPVDVPDEIPDIDIGEDVKPSLPPPPTGSGRPDDLIPDNSIDTAPINIHSNYAYIYGYFDDMMAPEEPITREEASAIINRILYQENQRGGFTKPQNSSYVDIDSSRWSYSALEYMTKIGVYNSGNGDRKIAPNSPATRGEVAKIISFSLGLRPTGKDFGFTDLAKNNKYYEYIDAMVSAGYYIGFENNTIRPNDVMNRADFVIMFNRIIGRDSSYALTYEDGTPVECPFVDIKNHRAYEDLMRGTNSFNSNKRVDPTLRQERNALDNELK